MNPFLLGGLGLAGLFGGLLGGKGRKPIDPQTLARLFGPNVLAGDTQTLYNTLAGSPAFSNALNSASLSGELAGQRTRANLAKAGLGGSGIGAISGAVSRGFGQNLQLGARANLWNTALQAARDNLAQRAGIYGQSQLQYQNTPTMAQSFGQGLSGLAATGFTALLSKPKAGEAEPAAAAPAPSTSVVSAPMKRVQSSQQFAPSTRFSSPY